MSSTTESPICARSIVGLALLALGGCGGIVSSDAPPECSFFSNSCNFDHFDFGWTLIAASVFPALQTAQVGAAVTFTVNSTAVNGTFQWRRSSDNGATWVAIVGATGPIYTLAAATLPDDGALFKVDVTSGTASVTSSPGRLTVSSMPGVVIVDGEFRTAEWTATAIPSTAAAAPTESVERVADDGSPGAYRRMVDAAQSLPASLRALHVYQGATYDPAIDGSVHAVDYAEDCRVMATAATVRSALLIEQDGRTYSSPTLVCGAPGWHRLTSLSSLTAVDFAQIAGPACPTGTACPDFTATGMPMRFGYARSAGQTSGTAPVTIEHHIDNWTVTVWRR